MHGRNLNYYGYDKETYAECSEMISQTNRNNLIGLNVWFIGVNFLYLIFSALNLFGVTQERVPFYVVYFLISLAFSIVVGCFHKFAEKHSVIFVYINMTILLSYGILVSALQPYLAATIYLFLIAVTALAYIDTMLRMTLMTISASTVFIYTSYKFKTFSIAYQDTYNLAIVLTLVIALHYVFQRMRIQQFVLYYRNLQIQNELEVKSSFDMLTGLLNRGSFFSIADELLRKNDVDMMAVCLFDLDGFKQINDVLGHQIGDKAIQEAGRAILECLGLKELYSTKISDWEFARLNGLAARLGGDEFIAVVCCENGRGDILNIIKNILETLNKLRFEGIEDGLKCSIGVTKVEKGDYDLDAAYKRADVAMYASKKAGKNQINFYGDLKNGEQGEGSDD